MSRSYPACLGEGTLISSCMDSPRPRIRSLTVKSQTLREMAQPTRMSSNPCRPPSWMLNQWRKSWKTVLLGSHNFKFELKCRFC